MKYFLAFPFVLIILGLLTDPFTAVLVFVVITTSILFLFILLMFPVFSALVIGGFILLFLFEYNTIDEEIINLLQEKNTITIGELLTQRGYGVSDYEDCKAITCLTYHRVKKMSESGEIILIDSNPLKVETKIILND